METYDVADKPSGPPPTVLKSVVNGADAQRDKDKRVVKLTAKAFAEKLERLQKDRKAILNKASNLKIEMRELIQKGEKSQVQCAFNNLLKLCDEVKGVHISVMRMLPEVEQEKHDVWFKAKMLNNDEFISKVQLWLSSVEQSVIDGCEQNVINVTNVNVIDDGINPEDSISNVASQHSSRKSAYSSRSSTTSSARIQAEADKAALLARMAALKEKHSLEEQEQQIRRQKERQELETMLAESAAKLAVLQASDSHSKVSNAMNSYLEREARNRSKPSANAINVIPQSELQQRLVPPANNPLPITRIPQRVNQHLVTRPKEWTKGQSHLTLEREALMPTRELDTQPTDLRQSEDLLTVMQRQNEITSALVQQQRLSSLPVRDIPLFDGDPLQYISFMRAFEQGVQEKASNSDCLYYLEQFTRGQPRELVRSCLHMTPEYGYAKAKQLLQEHFGCKYKIAAAYMERALSWPIIKTEDVSALQAYSLFLRGCCNMMEELQYMQELDMPSNIRAVVGKLPFKLRERWRTLAFDISDTTERRASFVDLVKLIERQVRILSDPLYGDISDLASGITGSKVINRPKLHQGNRFRGNSFATTTAPIESTESEREWRNTPQEHDSLVIRGCVYCTQGHSLEYCQQFKQMRHKDKLSFLKDKDLCFGCLRSGHRSRNCERRLICSTCGQRHPTLLHINRRETANVSIETLNEPEAQAPIASPKTCGQTGTGGDRCLLPILPVQVKSIKGDKIIQTYAFLDPGSSATFCSEQLMQRLNLAGRRTHFLLQTMGQERVVPAYSVSGLEVSGIDEHLFYRLPETLTQGKMPVNADNILTEGDLAKWPYLAKIKIPSIKANVDLLIGSNAPKMLEPWEVVNSSGDGPYAMRTALGWVINGPLQGNNSSSAECMTAMVNRISVCNLEEMLNNQYNHDFNESATEEKGLSREDIKFMEIMERSSILEHGHYCLNLPFRKKELSLPNNFSVAKQRALSLRRKFLKNELFFQEYSSRISEMVDKGYAEEVPTQQLSGSNSNVWYIPHHGVHHPRKKTIRVVFDCAATFKGTSLNRELLQGPNLNSTLLGVLLRFRQEPVAIMGDIQAMFHQVKVTKEDRDFLRFLWWPKGDLTKHVTEFRMTVHLFGAVSSPSCAIYALRRTADDNQADFSAEVIQTVKENFYVDDCLKSVASEEEAILMVKHLTALCQRGGFTLTKWVSNNRIVLQTLPEEHRAKDLKELNLDMDKLPLERALGLRWCAETDSFNFKMEIHQAACTRRGMLSVSSSVYDPLGFLAPVLLPAKIMLQELCRRNFGWDDTVPSDILNHWTRWMAELDMLSKFKVERCIKPKGFGNITHAQLHHFSDASETGYGTVTYLRMQNNKNNVHVGFLMGKARVTPLKAITIPRLELTAAVIAVRIDLMLRTELRIALQESVFWTDSMSVLKYIKNEDKRFHTFVANRVSTIREASKPSQWRYISSKENPADDASRGLRIGDFIGNSRWIGGPGFLCKPEEDWPDTVVDSVIEANDSEVKREVAVNVVNVSDSSTGTNRLIAHFSDWRRLKVAVAWFLKLKEILRNKSYKRRASEASNTQRQREIVSERRTLSLDDLCEAELAIIQYCQQQRFSEEIAKLSSENGAVSRQSILYKLDPRLDGRLLRVGGRLTKGALPEETKHPLILSKDQHVATLILKHIHQQLGHSGRSHVLSTLRRRYWITGANTAVRKIITECCFCRRHNAKMMEQKMGDLPKERILPNHPPFTNVGVDYFGPIDVKRGRGTVKRYGVIFTCLSSRAVHLEVANSLDTDACINVLRRFICRRGQVSHIQSDNGTNFIGTERELRESLAGLNQARIEGMLRQRGIKWSFNPPAGSHFGGVWERVIRMVRRILNAVLRQQRLDDDGLHTVMCEAEAILNDRPITKLSDDPNDLEPLTPNHILLMKGNPSLPPGLFQQHDLYSRRRWKQVQYISDLFWKRWIREYLPLLQERQKWNQRRNNLKVGDIVIIMDPAAPRGSWPLGRVLEAFCDKKGLVRSVRLQTKTNTIERPVTKLCLLQES